MVSDCRPRLSKQRMSAHGILLQCLYSGGAGCGGTLRILCCPLGLLQLKLNSECEFAVPLLKWKTEVRKRSELRDPYK